MAALCLNVLHGTKQILGMVMMSRLLGEATDATSIVGFGMSPVAVGYVVVNVIAADVLKLEGHQRSIARKDVQVRRHTRHEMYEIKGGQKTDRRETVITRLRSRCNVATGLRQQYRGLKVMSSHCSWFGGEPCQHCFLASSLLGEL